MKNIVIALSISWVMFLLILTFIGGSAYASEATETTVYCASINGEEEVRYYFKGHNYIKIDCETATEVIEAGLDKRSSLDSVQQAVFFSVLTGKKPVVVIYDTDNKEGRFEYRIRKACEYLGIEYRSIEAVT